MKTKRRSIRGLYSPELLEARIAPASFIVTTLADAGDGSLRKAIADANATPAADTITFQKGLTGKLTLATGEMDITESLTIKGPGAGLVILDGNDITRIFDIGDGTNVLKTVSISGLSLIHGNSAGNDGGAIRSTESLTLTKCVIADSTTEATGGGIFVGNTANTLPGTLTITSCTITGNSAGTSGGTSGGVHADCKGSVKIISSIISGNSATGSIGGLYVNIASGAKGDILVQNTTISGNTATNAKGGAGFDHERSAGGVDIGKVQIVNCTVLGNTAGTTAGGLYFESGIVTITNTTIAANTAVTSGGGIGVSASGEASLTLGKSRVLFNSVTAVDALGGGLFSDAPNRSIKVVGSLFYGNSAGGSGGGIAVANDADLFVQGSTFTGDSALGASANGLGHGGAILGVSGAFIDVKSSTFTDNTSSADGGAIATEGVFADAVNMVIAKSTFQRNRAGDEGGGIRVFGGGTLKITGSKFLDNIAAGSGGGLYSVTFGTVEIVSSLFARNQSGLNGGGLYFGNNGARTIISTVIVDNFAASNGGGLHLQNGTLTIQKSKITGNIAAGAGGGVRNQTGTPIILLATLISGNTAPFDPDKSGLFA